MLLSKSDLFDSSLEIVEDNVKILAEYSNSFIGWKLEYQHSYLDGLIFIYSPLISSMNIHLLPGNNSFFTNVEKLLKSDVRVMFDFLCQQLHRVYSLTHIRYITLFSLGPSYSI